MTNTLLDPVLVAAVADGKLMVKEIEAYLAKVATVEKPLPAPPIYPDYGRAYIQWNSAIPGPRRTVIDRWRNREAAPVKVSVHEFLTLTNRYLLQYGWCQRALYNTQGQVCVLGAMYAVLAHGYGTENTVQVARARIIEQIMVDHPGTGIDDWNDMPGRTRAQIHRQLEVAIARTRDHF